MSSLFQIDVYNKVVITKPVAGTCEVSVGRRRQVPQWTWSFQVLQVEKNNTICFPINSIFICLFNTTIQIVTVISYQRRNKPFTDYTHLKFLKSFSCWPAKQAITDCLQQLIKFTVMYIFYIVYVWLELNTKYILNKNNHIKTLSGIKYMSTFTSGINNTSAQLIKCHNKLSALNELNNKQYIVK